MTAFKSDFLNTLQERGFIHQCSDFEGLDALAAKGEATTYVGYDCTAPSLHIGNYLTMMMLHWLQQSGNKPITLMGGGTTMVGDPSGMPILCQRDTSYNATAPSGGQQPSSPGRPLNCSRNSKPRIVRHADR